MYDTIAANLADRWTRTWTRLKDPFEGRRHYCDLDTQTLIYATREPHNVLNILKYMNKSRNSRRFGPKMADLN